MAGSLSAEDVQRLMKDPSVDNRAEAASKVAGQFEAGTLSEGERALAQDIFRIMVKDVEERVRAALSDKLKNASNIPKDVALSLAEDVSDAVALPIIQFSEALSDEELISIIRTQSVDRQVAVASRSNVSEAVADTLVEEGDKQAVVVLVSNDSVDLTENTLNKVVDNYGDDAEVQSPLVHRSQLPINIAERLVTQLSDDLKAHLVAHHELGDETATDLILQARERATISLVSAGADEEDVNALVAQLHENGRLTPSIILRSLSVGDLAFFEASMSVMAKVPLQNTRILIHDEGELGFKSLYGKAGMPGPLFGAFKTAVELVRSAEGERYDDDPDGQMRRMLEHILTVHEDMVDEYGGENVEYLLTKFNSLASDASSPAG